MLKWSNFWRDTVTFSKGVRGDRGRNGLRGSPGPPGPAGLPSLYLWHNTQEEWASFMVRLYSFSPSLSLCNLWNIIALETDGCKPGPVAESDTNSKNFPSPTLAIKASPCAHYNSDRVMAASLLDSISDSKFKLLPRPWVWLPDRCL